MKTILVVATLWLIPASAAADVLSDAFAPVAIDNIVWPPSTAATFTLQAPQDPKEPPPTPPPASSAPEEVVAEARSFVSILAHNLADDVKHLPRRNSLYFAAGGGALAWAVHPYDAKLNRHFRGSDAWDHFFIP